jgi:hypothetical protein
MDQTVAAEHDVGLRQRIRRQVEPHEAPYRVLVAAVRRDELGDDIGPDIAVELERRLPHPLEIAARNIEQRASADAGQERRQLRADGGRVL